MSTINVPDDERTIQGAVNRAQDGDTVVVHGESEAEPTPYEERVYVNQAGNGGHLARITVKAYPRRSVKMWGFSTDGTGEGLVLEGFQVVAEHSQAIHLIHIASPNVTIRDFAIIDAPWAAIYVDPVISDLPGGTIEDCDIYGCGTGIHTHGVGWKILNNNIERLIKRTDRDADYIRGWGEDLLIKGNHLHGTTQDEIGTAHVDGFQTFDNQGRKLHGLRFEDNIVEDCHQGMIFEDGNEPGDVADISIRNNWFRNCWGMGVLVKDGVRNVRVHRNLIQNIGNHGVFARRGAEVDVYANIFVGAGSNYHGDAITGGYNILNRQGHPFHSHHTDLLDVDPMLGSDGYPLPGSPAIGAAGGADIGRIRPDAPEPEPEEPIEEPSGHEHPDYADKEHMHYVEAHEHPELADADHTHHYAPLPNETRLTFEAQAQQYETMAKEIRDRLGE